MRSVRSFVYPVHILNSSCCGHMHVLCDINLLVSPNQDRRGIWSEMGWLSSFFLGIFSYSSYSKWAFNQFFFLFSLNWLHRNVFWRFGSAIGMFWYNRFCFPVVFWYVRVCVCAQRNYNVEFSSNFRIIFDFGWSIIFNWWSKTNK